MIGETIPAGCHPIDLMVCVKINRLVAGATDYLDLLSTRLNPMRIVVFEDVTRVHNEYFRYWLRALRFRFGALRFLTTLGRCLRIIPTQA